MGAGEEAVATLKCHAYNGAMETQIFEGVWEDLTQQHASEFSGKRVRVMVLEEEAVPPPNEAMLTALRKIAERSKRMPFSSGEDTLQMLREARAGKMFDAIDHG